MHRASDLSPSFLNAQGLFILLYGSVSDFFPDVCNAMPMHGVAPFTLELLLLSFNSDANGLLSQGRVNWELYTFCAFVESWARGSCEARFCPL